jgi:inhibitor of cysteine peptidase
LSTTLSVRVGKTFSVSLESNPSTGYAWVPEFDPKFFKVLKKEFVAHSNLAGTGGVENFDFEALESGTTKLHMVYKRAWETTIQNEKTLSINIVDR